MALVLVMLTGCYVPLRSYRLVPPQCTSEPCLKNPSALVVPIPDPDPAKEFEPVEDSINKARDCVKSDEPICLSFVEVDDMGELWDKAQLDTTLSLIRRANDAAGNDPAKAPIVIVFIHGWKNNAAWGNDNVRGFKSSLQVIYGRNRGTRPVRGIYIGWRGDLIPASIPVARQFSLYNREATAIRIPGATLSSALTQIALRTHENKDALAIFVGHSFGALLLERTLSEMTASQLSVENIAQQEADTATSAGASDDAAVQQLMAKRATASRADLNIFVNSAASATEAKQMLNFLTSSEARYTPFRNPGDKVSADDDRPLYVAVTSTADAATKLALPIGHYLPDVGFKQKGSFRNVSTEKGNEYGLACYDPHPDPHHWTLTSKAEGAQDQSSYYLSSAGHMAVLQSHQMLKAINDKQMKVASTGEVMNVSPQAIAECRKDLFDSSLHIISTFRLYDTHQCFAIQERPKRCNGTPYWLMEIDPDVVPDHSTIFTGRFISFMIDSFFTQPNGRMMNRASPQLTLSAK